jgi:nitrogen fixation protein NifX
MQRQLRVLDSSDRGGQREMSDTETMKVAFATDDLKNINQHFGSAERFAIYRIAAGGSSLLEVAEFGRLDQDGNENKLVDKFAVLADCIAVYSLAVGPSAVRQLMALGIQPLKLQYGTPIGTVLGELQQQLKQGPDGWPGRWMRDRRNPPLALMRWRRRGGANKCDHHGDTEGS